MADRARFTGSGVVSLRRYDPRMAAVLCEQCGYDLRGVPSEPDNPTIRCPECSHLNVPGLMRRVQPLAIVLAVLAPSVLLMLFIAFSVLLRLWNETGGRAAFFVTLALYCPAATFLGMAMGWSEYGRSAAYWRRWWHRPAIIATSVVANGLIAMVAWALL